MMNNKSFIFNKDNKKDYLLYISVIPLILYGLYKNGYLLYHNNYINTLTLFKIISLPIISILIGILMGRVFKNKKYELIRFGVIGGLTAPFNFNVIAYYSILIGSMFLVAKVPNKIKINESALLIAIFILINHIFDNSIIFNPMEVDNLYKFSHFDLFFGRCISYLYTSSIFYLIISYIVLCFMKTYKRNIALISSLTFVTLFALVFIINKDYNNNVIYLINGTTFFSFVYLAPINETSPSINYEIIIYSILLGILSFIFVYLFKITTGAIIAVLILSVIYRIYDIYRQKIFLKKH